MNESGIKSAPDYLPFPGHFSAILTETEVTSGWSNHSNTAVVTSLSDEQHQWMMLVLTLCVKVRPRRGDRKGGGGGRGGETYTEQQSTIVITVASKQSFLNKYVVVKAMKMNRKQVVRMIFYHALQQLK